MVVLRKLESAADVTEQAAKAPSTSPQSAAKVCHSPSPWLISHAFQTEKTDPAVRELVSEEEVCLLYRALSIHGTKETYIQRLQNPHLGALALLKKGHKLLFWEALDILETWGSWDLIFELCQQALNLGIDRSTPSFFVCDWKVWKMYIDAATKSADPAS